MADVDQWMLGAEATCLAEGCDWTTAGKNALGNASQHADREGHEVGVDLHYHARANPE